MESTEKKEAVIHKLRYCDIYIGGRAAAQNEEYMRQMGIKSVCAILDSFEDYQEYGCANYKLVALADDQFAHLGDVINETQRFLESAEKPLLVHCDYGTSRSAAICCWYLMNKNNWTYDEAFRDLKSVRKTVRPNDNFRRQLRNLETMVAYRHDGCVGVVWKLFGDIVKQVFH